MTCRVPDFAQTIVFQCNGSSRGACTLFGCTANMIRNGNNTVYLQIPSLSYATDNCKWSCTYGTTQSSSYLITVYSEYTEILNKNASLCKIMLYVKYMLNSNSNIQGFCH